MEYITALQTLAEKAKPLGATVRMHYRSDDSPTTHIEVAAPLFALELCGPLGDLETMCAALCKMLDAIDDANVPF